MFPCRRLQRGWEKCSSAQARTIGSSSFRAAEDGTVGGCANDHRFSRQKSSNRLLSGSRALQACRMWRSQSPQFFSQDYILRGPRATEDETVCGCAKDGYSRQKSAMGCRANCRHASFSRGSPGQCSTVWCRALPSWKRLHQEGRGMGWETSDKL